MAQRWMCGYDLEKKKNIIHINIICRRWQFLSFDIANKNDKKI